MSRILHHHAPPARPAVMRALAATAVACVAVAVTACGSSSSSSSQTSSALLGSQVQQDCTSVANVLSDGPDPDADSVGYAQAQVLPLRQLKISDARLRQDVLSLAAAYQAFTAGGPAAAAAVAKAENSVNSICPQAAP
ncbi:MAG TPA: hypothetical protein VIZ43_26455 [Trebonia sp.]